MNSRLGANMMRGGMPALLAMGVMLCVPLLGSLYLSANDYALWALCSSMASAFIVVDFGAVMLSAKLSSEGRLTRSAYWSCIGITSAPALTLSVLIGGGFPYYNTFSKIDTPNGDAFILIASVGLGCALRSVGTIFATISLSRDRYLTRSSLLLGGALTNASATLCALSLGAGLSSLPAGLIVGGLFQCAMGGILERPDSRGVGSEGEVRQTVRDFVRSKGLTSVAAVVILQADRWSLGLVAPVAIVGAYDIVSRIVGIPRVVLSTLSISIVPRFSNSPGKARRVADHASAIKILGAFAAFSLVGTAIAAAAAVLMLGSAGLNAPLGLVGAVSMVSVAAAATIVPTVLLNALGRPAFELWYLLPLAALSGLSYSVGIHLQDWRVMIALWFAANLVASAVFCPTAIRAAFRALTAAHSEVR